MIPGIDVSHWQKEIDWKEVKKSGIRFAFYKATEFVPGSTELYVDAELFHNAAGTAENRIHAGPYHFYRTHIPALTQAFAFLDTIKSLPFNLRPVLDLELAGKHGKPLCDDVLIFCEAVEDSLGVKPLIYSSGGFWRSYMIYGHFSNVACFTGYPLWLAQWGFYMPKPLYPFTGPAFWQYSQTGRIPGIVTHVDLDWFMGGEIEILPYLYSNSSGLIKDRKKQKSPRPAESELDS